MKMFSIARYAFGVAASVALLTGCSASGSTPSLGSSSTAPQTVGHHSIQELNRLFTMTNVMHKGIPVQHPLTHSWMHKAPPGTTGTLWATDMEYATVDIIAYPSGTLMGQVAGFSYPYGDCSDKYGNVYIADFDLEAGYEMTSSGVVIASWATGGNTIGCSVSKTGDVAFTNFYPGGVVVFPANSGSGTTYSGPGYDWPAGYDRNGNLYVECAYVSPCSSPSLFEGPMWTKLNFNKTIGFAAAVQNMGKLIGVADQEPSSQYAFGIYLTSVSAGTATSNKSIIMTDSGCSTYMDDSSSWGSINKKPDGVISKNVNQIAAANLFCLPSPINIYGKNGGTPIGDFLYLSYQYDYGVTFTKP